MNTFHDKKKFERKDLFNDDLNELEELQNLQEKERLLSQRSKIGYEDISDRIIGNLKENSNKETNGSVLENFTKTFDGKNKGILIIYYIRTVIY